jgi:DNA-binding NarL/FixJ family response regulator
LSRQVAVLPSSLIVVERREFIRGCLIGWLAKYVGEMTAIAVADVESALSPDELSRSAGAIIGMEASEQTEWLHRQIAWLRARHAHLPIALIVEAEQVKAAVDLAVELDLQGYIPVTSNLEVAAAAVRLMVAGGSYFPRPQNVDPRQSEPLPGYENSARISELTSRERAVLMLLASGMPNKVIAHRLSMSLSTVKAHVHHIIRKLRVGNRTEVALLARHLPADMAGAAKVSVSPVVMAAASRSGFRAEAGIADASIERHVEDLS